VGVFLVYLERLINCEHIYIDILFIRSKILYRFQITSRLLLVGILGYNKGIWFFSVGIVLFYINDR
jgi:hypothetical protein